MFQESTSDLEGLVTFGKIFINGTKYQMLLVCYYNDSRKYRDLHSFKQVITMIKKIPSSVILITT